MKSVAAIPSKILSLPHLVAEIRRWRLKNKTIAFTNGVFDILHEGHIASLSQAASLADILIVAVNGDESVKRLKGPDRPINNENSRALLLASMAVSDAVIIFHEDTPADLIKAILPDVLVKGGDYMIENIAGASDVLANGGKVVLADIVQGISTTGIIKKIQTYQGS